MIISWNDDFLVKNQTIAPAKDRNVTTPPTIAAMTHGEVLRFLLFFLLRLPAGTSSLFFSAFAGAAAFLGSSASADFFFFGRSSAAPAWTTFSSQGNTCSHFGHSISESGSGSTGRRSFALHLGQRSSTAMIGTTPGGGG